MPTSYPSSLTDMMAAMQLPPDLPSGLCLAICLREGSHNVIQREADSTKLGEQIYAAGTWHHGMASCADRS